MPPSYAGAVNIPSSYQEGMAWIVNETSASPLIDILFVTVLNE